MKSLQEMRNDPTTQWKMEAPKQDKAGKKARRFEAAKKREADAARELAPKGNTRQLTAEETRAAQRVHFEGRSKK